MEAELTEQNESLWYKELVWKRRRSNELKVWWMVTAVLFPGSEKWAGWRWCNKTGSWFHRQNESSTVAKKLHNAACFFPHLFDSLIVICFMFQKVMAVRVSAVDAKWAHWQALENCGRLVTTIRMYAAVQKSSHSCTSIVQSLVCQQQPSFLCENLLYHNTMVKLF